MARIFNLFTMWCFLPSNTINFLFIVRYPYHPHVVIQDSLQLQLFRVVGYGHDPVGLGPRFTNLRCVPRTGPSRNRFLFTHRMQSTSATTTSSDSVTYFWSHNGLGTWETTFRYTSHPASFRIPQTRARHCH